MIESGSPNISVILCTWNRSRLLGLALDSIAAQNTPGDSYELLVVDNNSTDETRHLVESFIARAPCTVRYIFEPKQGVSHARNAGIAASRAPLLAFFDDDVTVSADWLLRIENAFNRNKDIDFLGGKVLPKWRARPPSWLTADHWAPLALQDYGDALFTVGGENSVCLVSANLAIRRAALDETGWFRPELQRVRNGIGSIEDQELLERLLKRGKAGLYVPNIVAWADVPVERMTRAYHRRWHRGHGRFYGIGRSPAFERSNVGRLFDVPAHLYRQATVDLASWIGLFLSRNAARRFAAESRLWFFAGFVSQRLFRLGAPRSRREGARRLLRLPSGRSAAGGDR